MLKCIFTDAEELPELEKQVKVWPFLTLRTIRISEVFVRCLRKLMNPSACIISMYNVQYTLLDKIRPLIDATKELEKGVHKRSQNEKEANWMLHTASEAGIDLEPDMQYEVQELLGQKSKNKMSKQLQDSRL